MGTVPTTTSPTTTSESTKKLSKEESDELKRQGALRAQFVRQHCYAWMEKNKLVILTGFQDAAWAKYPKGEPSSEFKVDASLLAAE